VHLVEGEAVGCASTEMIADGLGHEVCGHVNAHDSGGLELFERALQHRFVTNRQQRLRNVVGQWTKASTESARHHDRGWELIFTHKLIEFDEIGDAAFAVDEGNLTELFFANELKCFDASCAGRQSEGLVFGMPKFREGHIQVAAFENGAAQVTISDEVKQAFLFIDDERNTTADFVDYRHNLKQGLLRGDKQLLKLSSAAGDTSAIAHSHTSIQVIMH
jgi:hypothetical protein